MNTRAKERFVPTLFGDSFFPSIMRHMTLFDDDNFMPLKGSSNDNISLYEDETHTYIEAHLPGVDKENIEVTQDKGALWIKGEAKQEDKDEERKYYTRAVRSFSYHVAIPGNIDETKEPSASYENGVIKIAFSKQQKEMPKKINISS